jgi:electron transfer flavoprotein beta subunit
MPFDIVVCIKQVPHPDYISRISLDPATGSIRREGVPAVINPSDRNALEAALSIRDDFSGKVIVLTMGPPQARKAVEDALAMGADTGILICDRALAGADTLATARTLAYGIAQIEHFDLVLCGDTTIDSGTGQVAVQLAQFLDLPCVTDVEELTCETEQSLLVKRAWERGYIRARAKLPAVIGVTAKANQPRLPNILGIMAVAQKEIIEWNCVDTGADVERVGLGGSPTQIFEVTEFHARRQGEIFQGPPEETVNLAVDQLVKLEVL